MVVSFEFLRGILGILGLACAYMAGRSLVAVRKGWQKMGSLYGWLIRMMVCLAAVAFRHSIDVPQLICGSRLGGSVAGSGAEDCGQVIGGQGCPEGLEAARHRPVPDPGAPLLPVHQAGLVENSEMVAHGRLRSAQWLDEGAGTDLPAWLRSDQAEEP